MDGGMEWVVVVDLACRHAADASQRRQIHMAA